MIRSAIVNGSKIRGSAEASKKLKKLLAFFAKFSRAGRLGQHLDEDEVREGISCERPCALSEQPPAHPAHLTYQFKAMLAAIECMPANKYDIPRIFGKLDKVREDVEGG